MSQPPHALFISVQFCSVPDIPYQSRARLTACRLGLSPQPMLFTSLPLEVLQTRGPEICGFECLRPPEGKPCEVALEMGLL